MLSLTKSALLVAALSAPLVGGFAPAAFGAESAASSQGVQTLVTTKGDRGVPSSPTAQMILASIAAEGDN